MLPVAILAGGLATRMWPLTQKIPKALIEVEGRPFALWQLEYLRDQGIDRVVFCVGYLGEQIERLVGDGSKQCLNITYSFDGPVLLGTGGALRQALPLLGEQFFVLYGDTFLPIEFAPVERAFLASGKRALMTVFRNERSFDQSNATFCDGLVDYDKKAPRPEMNYIDYGLGVLTADLFDAFPSDAPFDLAELYKQLSLASQLAGFEVHERFYEIGSAAGLKDTERYLREHGGQR